MPVDVFNYALYKLQEKKIISGLKFTKDYDGKIIRVYMSGLHFTENAVRYYNDLKKYNPLEAPRQSEIQAKCKVFISHSSLDLKYVKAIVELMEDIGVPEKGIFCSSMPGYSIPLGRDIYNYIREQLLAGKVMACYIFSENFYDSEICLNEMGAIWSLGLKYAQIFLPGFDLRRMKGVVDSKIVGIKLDDNIEIVRERLGEMRDELVSFLGLPKMSEAKWERKREGFIRSIM